MIEIMSLNKTYKAGNRALKNINITIEDGEFVFIMAVSYTHLDVYKRQVLAPERRREQLE